MHGAGTGGASATAARRSAAWTAWFRVQYRVIRFLDPLVRAWLGRPGLADTVDLVVVGRRSGRPRPVLVGLLDVDGCWYVGHPNGAAQWTRNLEAADRATVRRPGEAPIDVTASHLSVGAERSAAIRATFVQHPFPGNLAYRLARRHVEAVGAFYRLEPLAPVEPPAPVEAPAPVEQLASLAVEAPAGSDLPTFPHDVGGDTLRPR